MNLSLSQAFFSSEKHDQIIVLYHTCFLLPLGSIINNSSGFFSEVDAQVNN